MVNEYGLKKLERIYQKKIAPNTVRVLMSVFGVEANIFRVKNKRLKNTIASKAQLNNKYSREVYQNNSLLANNTDEYSIIDSNESDYLNDLDKIATEYVLLTTQTFENFNGFIAGLDQEMNMYCLTFDFKANDIIEISTKEGIRKRYKIRDIQAIGDTTTVLKRFIVISLAI